MRSLEPTRRASWSRFFRLKRPLEVAGVLVIVFLCAAPGVLRAQVRKLRVPLIPVPTEIGRAPSQFVAGDTIEILARRVPLFGDWSLLSRYPIVAYPDFRARRPVPLSLVLRPRTIEQSRFSCAIHGADLGAGTASTLGGLGLLTGVWGGKTTGYMMGAGALLGAIWGGTAGADDSRFRFRIGVDASDPAVTRHDLLPDDRRP